MRRMLIVVVVLSVTAGRGGFAHEADVETLLAESKPEIQEQIKRIYSSAFGSAARDDLKNPGEALEELQRLGEITEDKGEIVKQLAIFVATNESEEDLHSMVAGDLLEGLRLPAGISIRVLAPYLDAENEKLRSFAYGWFHNHDSYDRIHGRPPLGSVNYYDYAMYVRNRLEKNEEVPAPFIKYIYERHPGKALLVFAYSYIDFSPAHRHRQLRRELELSEHIVSNAIWLKENGFAERFQKTLPEANAELAKLAKHEEWWVRLYVAEIMRRYRELRALAIIQQLVVDSNAHVSKAAKAAHK